MFYWRGRWRFAFGLWSDRVDWTDEAAADGPAQLTPKDQQVERLSQAFPNMTLVRDRLVTYSTPSTSHDHCGPTCSHSFASALSNTGICYMFAYQIVHSLRGLTTLFASTTNRAISLMCKLKLSSHVISHTIKPEEAASRASPSANNIIVNHLSRLSYTQ